ncbi:uncharacterized protein LOC144007849 isoform X2 [Festucalex cinctus]
MDFDALQKLNEAIGQPGQTIMDYFEKLDNPRIRDVLASYDSNANKVACIMLLLMTYFKEAKEAFVLEVDPCATAVDVNTGELPSTPLLIVQAITCSTWSILLLHRQLWSSFRGASWASTQKEAQRARNVKR